jgi:NodT family efflux transporter outer membrane factor (OMF) lipoprotein
MFGRSETRIAPYAAAALFGALLLSCAVKPAPSLQEMTQALPETTKIPGQWKAPLPGDGGAVADGWLKSFGDPRLESLAEEAVQNNPSLKAAAQQIQMAAGYATQASAALYPISSIPAGAGGIGHFKKSNISGNEYISEMALYFNISWELDIWGKIRSQAAAARENLNATEADVEWGRQSLVALVAKTYYLAAQVNILVRLQERAVELYRQEVAILEAKQAVGQVSDQMVAEARQDLSTSQAALLQAKQAQQDVVRALEVLLGRYPAAELEAATQLPPLPATMPAGIPSDILERRPDIYAAEQQVAAAFHMVQSAKLAKLPGFGLGFAVGNQASEITKYIRIPMGFWSLGFNMLLPLFTGGALQSEVDIRTAEQEAALQLFIQKGLAAFREVETGLATEANLGEQGDLLDTALAESRKAYDLAKIKYDVGETDMLPVVQQEGNLLTAQANLVGVQYALLNNRISLNLALGGSFQEPVPE